MDHEYHLVPFFTGCTGGGIDKAKLLATLNEHAAQGWELQHTIHETTKVMGFFQRETHFLIFVRRS